MLVHCLLLFLFFFCFNDTATTEIYTLSLHDVLPISISIGPPRCPRSTNSPFFVPTRSSASSSSDPTRCSWGRVAVCTAPPEIEGRTWMSSPSETRESNAATSPFRKTLACSRIWPCSSVTQPSRLGCCRSSDAIPSPMVRPSTSTRPEPPARSLRGGRSFTATMEPESSRTPDNRGWPRSDRALAARASTGAERREAVARLGDRREPGPCQLGELPGKVVEPRSE